MPIKKPSKIFYACGPGDTVKAHQAWTDNKWEPSELSGTYSAEVAEFVRLIGADGLFVSQHPRPDRLSVGRFVVEHRPKPWPRARGIAYHVRETLYGAALAWRAFRSNCDFAIVSSGTTHPFVCTLFCMLGMRVVYVMHNTLWPMGRRPTDSASRLIHALNGLFFARGAHAVLGVSPECLRQVDTIARTAPPPEQLHFMPHYEPNRFADMPPPPPHGCRPFRIVFVGRLTRDKGVLDIPTVARLVDEAVPGQVEWCVWGQGDAEGELQAAIDDAGVRPIVHYKGWASPDNIAAVYAGAHLGIVPTRDSFAEGLAKTVLECVIAGRPVITTAVVPAAEVVHGACIVAPANQLDALADAVVEVVRNRSRYEALRRQSLAHVQTIFSNDKRLRNILMRTIGDSTHDGADQTFTAEAGPAE